MCCSVRGNPKGVTNLFSRNIQQAPSSYIWKEPAGETKRDPKFVRMMPRSPQRNHFPVWPCSRGTRLSWGILTTPIPHTTLPPAWISHPDPQPVIWGLWGQLWTRRGLEFSAVLEARAVQGACQTGIQPGFPAGLGSLPSSWHWDRRVSPSSVCCLTRFPSLMLKHLYRLGHSSCVPGNGPRHPEASQPSNLRK